MDINKQKQELATYFDSMADKRDSWRKKNQYYHSHLERIIIKNIPEGSSVLELGCGTGELLASCKPSCAVGIDLSPRMIAIAKEKYPQHQFLVQDAENLENIGKFDFIIMSDLIGHLQDIWKTLRGLHAVCHKETRVIITYYNFVWEPAVRIAEKLNLKMRQSHQNWLGMQDIKNLLYLADFEVKRQGTDMLIPVCIPVISNLINNNLSGLSFFRWAALLQYFIAKPSDIINNNRYGCSVIIPTRNEKDNIENCIKRIPELGKHTEIIFVDGASTDGTEEKIREQIRIFTKEKDIKLIRQVPEASCDQKNANTPDEVRMLPLGKGDAVRKGFQQAKGDILMILDADLTVPPEDLPKFYDALSSGKARFANGTRLVYPLENEAMPVINYFGNKFFSILFTWLLGQPIKDTLCGTKAIFKDDYLKIAQGRSYFGNFDPFGDFDLLFGAARQKLKITEIPVSYRRRTSGYSKVQVYKHGLLLIKMSFIAFKKFKLNKWFRQDGQS